MNWYLLIVPSLVDPLAFPLAFISLSGFIGDKHLINSVVLSSGISSIPGNEGVIAILVDPSVLRDRECSYYHGVLPAHVILKVGVGCG